jgi:vitamin K-dependent gamma-carboxylase
VLKSLTFLMRERDATPLYLWRMVYGFVMFFETAGAVAIGWVKEVYLDPPNFTFNFIGFDFLQPLPGYGMYYWFGAMAVCSLGVMLGYRYRLSAFFLALLWTGAYLMHKESYNNHHYLMFLLNWMLVFTPLHLGRSLDVKHKRVQEYAYLPTIFWLQYIGLFLIVFFYAALAKVYPDWLNALPLKIWLGAKSSWLNQLISLDGRAYLMAYGGVVFDFLVIPALLYKPTRWWAIGVSVIFHISNSITFQIGTFPYLMIGATVLFFSGEELVKLLKLKRQTVASTYQPLLSPKLMVFFFYGFMAYQVLIPLRHYGIPGNVYWTEEGHRLSWRMMLRAKQGTANFRLVLPDGDNQLRNPRGDMTEKQYRMMATRPDFIWQYCQWLKPQYPEGTAIYVSSSVRLNGRKPMPLIDGDYNMAKAKWHWLKHEEWITEFEGW